VKKVLNKVALKNGKIENMKLSKEENRLIRLVK
jgi:hypothetical protein